MTKLVPREIEAVFFTILLCRGSGVSNGSAAAATATTKETAAAAGKKLRDEKKVPISIKTVIRCISVLRIRIRRIHIFLGLPDPHPDLLVRDTDPDPSIIKQK